MEKNKLIIAHKNWVSSDFQDGFSANRTKLFASKENVVVKPEKSDCKINSKITKRKNSHLSIVAARKMLQRLLVEKQMSMWQLAEALKIDTKSLEKIFSSKDSSELVAEINLSLIELYCSTKWNIDL